MAGIMVGQAFERTSKDPIDSSIVLSKAEMVLVDDGLMPDQYFAICKDDGKLYLYNINNTPSAETGKFVLQQGGGTYDDTAVQSSITTINQAIANMYTKTETNEKIDEKLAEFDRLDYKVADSAPTATKVVIDGTEVDVVEGTRYLVQITGEDKFEEYVVLDGTVYDLGNAAGGVSAELTNAITVSNPIGKHERGDVLAAATPLENILRGMLSQTYYPTLTDPKATLSISLPATAKVGETVTGGAATVAFDAGKIDPQYTATSADRAGAATGYTLTMAGAASEFSDNNTTGSFTVPSFTKNSKGAVTLTASVDYGAGVQPKDSDGEDYGSPLAAGTVTASKTVQFILPFVYGVSGTSTITDFTGLTEELTGKGKKEYRFTTVYEHPVIAYDAAHGDLASILDQNGFETIGGWTKSTLSVDGQNYFVYVHNNATKDTNAKYTFSF